MERRTLLTTAIAAAAGTTVGLPRSTLASDKIPPRRPILEGAPLIPPAKGKIKVAFAVADHATLIDFAGPWEVFQDVHVHNRGSTMEEMMPFELYTVASSVDPIRISGGMKIIPNFSVDDAPMPHLVVVPALQGNPKLLEWLVAVAPETDVTMSVCTGAFQLAEAGLLDGLVATTHHEFYDQFQKDYPNVQLERGMRFVENRRISTAGGLTSSIDLALHVVERYFGRGVASWTADYMEYTGTGWEV